MVFCNVPSAEVHCIQYDVGLLFCPRCMAGIILPWNSRHNRVVQYLGTRYCNGTVDDERQAGCPGTEVTGSISSHSCRMRVRLQNEGTVRDRQLGVCWAVQVLSQAVSVWLPPVRLVLYSTNRLYSAIQLTEVHEYSLLRCSNRSLLCDLTAQPLCPSYWNFLH